MLIQVEVFGLTLEVAHVEFLLLNYDGLVHHFGFGLVARRASGGCGDLLALREVGSLCCRAQHLLMRA